MQLESMIGRILSIIGIAKEVLLFFTEACFRVNIKQFVDHISLSELLADKRGCLNH